MSSLLDPPELVNLDEEADRPLPPGDDLRHYLLSTKAALMDDFDAGVRSDQLISNMEQSEADLNDAGMFDDADELRSRIVVLKAMRGMRRWAYIQELKAKVA